MASRLLTLESEPLYDPEFGVPRIDLRIVSTAAMIHAIESCSQTGHRRMMTSSQASFQSVAILSAAAETETKTIVSRRGSASGFTRPRSSSEAEPPPEKTN